MLLLECIGACRSKFKQEEKSKIDWHRLPSIRNGNNKRVVCTFSGELETFYISVNKKNNTATFFGNSVKVTSFTDTNVYLTWKSKDKSKTLFTELNFGLGTFKIRQGNDELQGSCEEIR